MSLRLYVYQVNIEFRCEGFGFRVRGKHVQAIEGQTLGDLGECRCIPGIALEQMVVPSDYLDGSCGLF